MYESGQVVEKRSTTVRLPMTESSLRFIRQAKPVWEPIIQGSGKCANGCVLVDVSYPD